MSAMGKEEGWVPNYEICQDLQNSMETLLQSVYSINMFCETFSSNIEVT